MGGQRGGLRAEWEGEREGWAAANLEKAQQKVRDRQDNVRQSERSVKRLGDWVAREAKVKEDVEEKVVEEKVSGGGGVCFKGAGCGQMRGRSAAGCCGGWQGNVGGNRKRLGGRGGKRPPLPTRG